MKTFIIFSFILLLLLVPVSFSVDGGDFPLAPAVANAQVGEAIHSAFVFVLKYIAFVPIAITGVLVYISGVLLNVVAVETVLQLGNNLKDINGINEAWSVLRDLANIFFIFGLLAIAISTILGLSSYGYKKLLATLIIVALLINFSLFFTKFIIDASNLVATQFYTAIVPSSPVESGLTGISNSFMKQFGLSTVWDSGELLSRLSSIGNTFGTGIALMFAYGILVSIFFAITAFVFFYAAILLIIRTVAFVLLMVLSPLAFAAYVLPATNSLTHEWWKKLINYALFAPILFILFWVTLTIMPGLTSAIGANGTNISAIFSSDGNFQATSIKMIMNFLIVSVFMIASIIIANRLSLGGSKFAMNMSNKTFGKWGGKAIGGYYGAIGRNTIGRGASELANSTPARKLAELSPAVGGATIRGLKNVAGKSFDARGVLDKDLQKSTGAPQKGGYTGAVKATTKRRQDTLKEVEKMYGTPEEKAEARGRYAENLRRGNRLTKLAATVGGALAATVGGGPVAGVVGRAVGRLATGGSTHAGNESAAENIEKINKKEKGETRVKEIDKDIIEINKDLAKLRSQQASNPEHSADYEKKIAEKEDAKADLEIEKLNVKEDIARGKKIEDDFKDDKKGKDDKDEDK